MKRKSNYKRLLAISSTVLLLTASMPAFAAPANALVSFATQAATLSSSSFSDVPKTAWYAETINSWVKLGLLDPTKQAKLNPQEAMTRGNFASYLAIALGLSPISNNAPFTDLTGDDKLSGYIAALKKEGLVNGYTDGTFRPNAQITRAEVASFIVNAKKLAAAPDFAKKFTDVKQGSWYEGVVGSLAQTGIANGKTTTTFAPNANITIAEGITFINRAFYTLPTIQDIQDNGTVTIQGISYSIAPAIKGIFKSSNKEALIGSGISFTAADGKINSIEQLIIGYNSTKESVNAPLLFDGDDAEINGDLIINADHVMMSRLTINNNLILTHEVENNFFTFDVVVREGTTFLKDNDREDDIITNLWFDNSDLGHTRIFNNVKVRNFDVQPSSSNLSYLNTTLSSASLASTNYLVAGVASSNHEAIQSLYIAYFSRPAEPVGLQYWEEIVTSSGGAQSTDEVSVTLDIPEYTELYGGLSSSDHVNRIYQNLFGRDAETHSLGFWAAQVENGNPEIALVDVSSSKTKVEIQDIDDISIDVSGVTEISAGPSTTITQLEQSAGSSVDLLSNTLIVLLSLGSSNSGADGSQDASETTFRGTTDIGKVEIFGDAGEVELEIEGKIDELRVFEEIPSLKPGSKTFIDNLIVPPGISPSKLLPPGYLINSHILKVDGVSTAPTTNNETPNQGNTPNNPNPNNPSPNNPNPNDPNQ